MFMYVYPENPDGILAPYRARFNEVLIWPM